MRFLLCLFFLIHFNLFAQERKIIKRDTAIAISLKAYKAKRGIMDSTGFSIKGKDTLIHVSNNAHSIREKEMVEYEFKDSIFLEAYKNIVYNTHGDSLRTKTKNSMHLWKDEIKIYFDESVDSLTISEFKNFISPIDIAIDSLSISYVNKKENSNYFIYYTNSDYPINHDERLKSKAGFYANWDKSQFIYACNLRIDTDSYVNFEYRLRILKKRFIQTLGYFFLQNDMRGSESIFSTDYSTLPEKVTGRDLELLQYHYSYGICKGTNLQTFEEQHRMSKKSLKEHPNRKLFILHPVRNEN